MATLTTNPQTRAMQLAYEIVEEEAANGGDMQELKARAERMASKYAVKALSNETPRDSQAYNTALERVYLWKTVVRIIEEEHE